MEKDDKYYNQFHNPELERRVDEVLAEKKKKVENLNKIAELIQDVGFAYDQYEDTVRTLNMHHGLVYDTPYNAPDFLEIEPCNFESFEETHLKELTLYWQKRSEDLKKKHSKLYYNVDTDDYK